MQDDSVLVRVACYAGYDIVTLLILRKKKTFSRGVDNQETNLTQVMSSRAEQNLGNVDGKLLPSPLHQPSVAKRSKNINVT